MKGGEGATRGLNRRLGTCLSAKETIFKTISKFASTIDLGSFMRSRLEKAGKKTNKDERGKRAGKREKGKNTKRKMTRKSREKEKRIQNREGIMNLSRMS